MAGKDSPYGRAIYAADKNNLQPRIGAAWDPGGVGRTVVRAGYGMYFDQTQVGMFAQNVQGDTSWFFTDPFRTDVFVSNAPLSNPRGGHKDTGASASGAPDTDVDLGDSHTCASRPATRSWRLDGSTGTSACSDASTPAA